jgi:AP-3 complex subunit beta
MSRSEFLDGSDSGSGVIARARTFMSGDSQFFSAQPNFEQIRKQLESDSLSTKKEAMKRVVAQICLGNNMSALFPDVVKNIHAASIELRKLIYYFIVHYSDERPNEALLSISAFQHDLVDNSMHVRALALRTLSSIRIAAINPVVLVAIKKCSTDLTPLVRRTAATAIAKASRIAKGEDNVAQAIPVIHQLLGDRSMEVVGAAAATFMQICPTRFDLVHKHFRRICRGLLEADEWGQINLLSLLLRYARSQFVDPNKDKPKVAKKKVKPAKGSDDDSDSDSSATDSDESVDILGKAFDLDGDHRLLLTSVKPLFMSLNRAVVLAAVSLYYHVAPLADLDYCAKPLLRLLTGDASGHYVALVAIESMLKEKTQPFLPYFRDFFLAPNDSPATRRLRLRTLAKLATKDNHNHIVTELRSYLRSYDIAKVVDAIRCLGLVTYQLPESTSAVIKHILPLLSHRADEVVTESVVVLRQLVVQSADKSQTTQIVQKLAHRVLKGTVTTPSAKASIIWLVGENIRTHPNIAMMAPDFFRLFVKSFKTEHVTVKSHVITLGLKIWLNLEGEGPLADRFKAIFFYLLELVKYDADYDVRDQGRLVQTVLDRQGSCFEALKASSLAPKPLPQQVDGVRHGVLLGSMSHVLGTTIQGYVDLSQWPTEMPEPTAREPPEAASSSSSAYSSSGSEAGGESDTESSESSDELSDNHSASSESSDSDDERPSAKAPRAAPAPKAPAKAPVKVKIVTKVVAKAAAAAARPQVMEQLFTKKHADPAAATPAGDTATAAPAKPTAFKASFTVVDDSDDEDTVKDTVLLTNQTDEDIDGVALDADTLGAQLKEGVDDFDVAAGETHEVIVKLDKAGGKAPVPLTFSSGEVSTTVPVSF